MVLEKIPTFSEVQTWANNNLVSSVNGNTGDVTVENMWTEMTEIPESPYDFNDIEKLTINLSETYDRVIIDFQETVISGERVYNGLKMRINDDGSSNYRFIDSSGGTTTDENQWTLDSKGNYTSNGHGYVTISGKWNYYALINGNISLGSIGNELQYGRNKNVSSPLQKIEIARVFGSSGTHKFSGKIKVYGINL